MLSSALLSATVSADLSGAREQRCEVYGTSLAWREWGDAHAYPVLALHGWLDNAASFDALAPLLPGRRIIALDLPGHGLSAHRGVDGTYNIWDDLPVLLCFIRALGLERYALIGHSRGAAIASLLAAIEPAAASTLVMLDGALVPQFDDAQTLDQLQRFTRAYAGFDSHAARVFPSVDAAVDARCRATGIDRRAASVLVARGLQPVDGGFCWRTDARLRYPSALKLTPAKVRSVLSGISAPTLLLLTGIGIAQPLPQHESLDWYPGLQRERIGSCHHCHMLEAAPEIAARITRFWRDCGQA